MIVSLDYFIFILREKSFVELDVTSTQQVINQTPGCLLRHYRNSTPFSETLQQTVAVAPMLPPNLIEADCRERAGVYHVSLDSLTSLNDSFNNTGYTTYIFKVQSMENSSLSTHIWLVMALVIVP